MNKKKPFTGEVLPNMFDLNFKLKEFVCCRRNEFKQIEIAWKEKK